MGKIKKYFLIYFSIVLILAAFGGGLLIGQIRQIKATNEEWGWQIFQKQQTAPAEVDFSLFWQVWDQIKEKFANKEHEITDEEKIYGAIKGMVESLNDPYTAFMDPKETEEFNAELDGTFEGIGAEVGLRNERLVIIAPLSDSPAEKAGLRSGDIILKINNQDTLNLSLIKAVSLIRGEKGSGVVLTIFRKNESQTEEIKIIRDTINVPSVNFSWLDEWLKKEQIKNDEVFDRMKNKKIAMIAVSRFSEDTDEEFRKIAESILKNQAQGIILDLRSNPGGFLEAAIDLAEEFIQRGEIVVVESFANDIKQEFKSYGNARLENIPLAVLVDRGSASASEILAGALQDYKLGYLIGEKTFGKGSVQDLEQFNDGSSLKVTIAKWLTPQGRLINDQGLDPDLKVEIKEEDLKDNKDQVMIEAVRYLEEKMSK